MLNDTSTVRITQNVHHCSKAVSKPNVWAFLQFASLLLFKRNKGVFKIFTITNTIKSKLTGILRYHLQRIKNGEKNSQEPID